MALSPSRRKLVNAKATKQYLEAFFDAARLQSEANRLVPDIEHAVEQQRQLERERSDSTLSAALATASTAGP